MTQGATTITVVSRSMTALTTQQMRTLADAALDADLIPSDQHDALFARLAVNLRVAADQLEAVRAEVTRYAGWHEQSPEDSWRFERDLRTALGMDQYSGDDDD